ncbi:tripartite tricarboxylate transporter substrate binding protein [Variovorax sp. J22R24]|uniref:tripartite tricarboxylate transporter substrate binding protein n=1 Tax=Variovorax gracilis TaxID=3053502 RepID=UPI0025767F24|nr:tripartite tricarboxylate transporter substrate binding protein [Variovorax sp. J22R24]MDM0108345.1 tripartite tricarboxylate transporter substrate binding protein [Variovorax sp. J22R24]
MTTRRGLLCAGASMAALGAAPWARSQAGEGDAFPQHPLVLWVPWSAGGGTDITLRLLAELAGRQLGQRIVIENRGGAGGTLAMPILQQSPADGYTLAQMPQPVFRAPFTQKVAWDPIRDTTPILQVSGVTFGLLVPAASPVRSVAELLAYAAAHPGRLSIATNGVGTTPHVVLDALFARNGLSFIHVPYKGAAEQMIALSSGQVMAGVNANGFAPYVDSGGLRMLAVFGASRSRRWPDVPTMSELGHGIVATSPYGLAGPCGMPGAIVQRLHAAFKTALFDPRHVAELARYDQEVAYLDSADYGRSMREAYAAEKRTVERLGLGAV